MNRIAIYRHNFPRILLTATLLTVLSMVLAPDIYAQSKWRKEAVRVDPVVCYASEETGHAAVPPPQEFMNRLKSAPKSSDIVVKYINFPDSAREAFEYAVGIWETLISTSVPIYVEARWERLNSGTLGNCSANGFYVNFDGAPMADTYYPVAIVEKITGKEITGSANPDMTARFNSSVAWYYGTDLKTPGSKYDFISTVLHEIAHGLGITGFFNVNASTQTGYYGYGNKLPSVFDRWVEDFSGSRITNQTLFKNPSSDLYYKLISNQLYSGSPVAFGWNYESRPRLYAPSTYKDGSSIYHLNDISYPYGSVNALMTSSAGRGEAVHTPGPLTSGILADLGWKHLYFNFLPLHDREEIPDALKFATEITSDLGILGNSCFLIYSTDNFESHSDSVALEKGETENGYSAVLDPGTEPVRIRYYFTARDTMNRSFTWPPGSPSGSFSLTLGPDTVKPLILHDPVTFVLSSSGKIDLEAVVTDNLGVDSVFVVFYINGQEQPGLNLLANGDSLYRGKFPLDGYKTGDTLGYVVVAIDIAAGRNISRLPATGYFTVKVEQVFNPVITYFTDFNIPNDDFILSDFSINIEGGFDNAALHSPHPYPSPDTDDTYFNFTTMLRYPVIVVENGKMAWDEVVLVEPGEEGAVFGGDEFWDYVIVEASKDFGMSWLPLRDGYDSGSIPMWKSAYNQRIVGNNSITIGNKDLFVRREILLTENGNFTAGDTLLIRFRLLSDPYAHGWGWAIDNLEIQQNLTSPGMTTLPPSNFLVWPNPVENYVNFSVDIPGYPSDYVVQILDMAGRPLASHSIDQSRGEVIRFDIRHLKAGFYLIHLTEKGKTLFIRKVVKL